MTSGDSIEPPDARHVHVRALRDLQGEARWVKYTPANQARLERRARLVAQCLEGMKAPVVVELGCGAGLFARMLLTAAPDARLAGIDLAPRALAFARSHAPTQHAAFVLADALELPVADGVADMVVGNAILQHLPLRAALNETFRVLKPGGVALFTEPNRLNPAVAIEEHVGVLRALTQTTPHQHVYQRWQVMDTLNTVGFREASVQAFDFLHPLVPGALVPLAGIAGSLLERVPLVRETAGALLIQARK